MLDRFLRRTSREVAAGSSRPQHFLRFTRGKVGDASRGVTMIEFALVIFIFLAFIIALFDFVRYLIVQSILRSAASRAVSQASVIDWLDANCATMPDPGTCSSNRTTAY